jgi:hypothetical protein
MARRKRGAHLGWRDQTRRTIPVIMTGRKRFHASATRLPRRSGVTTTPVQVGGTTLAAGGAGPPYINLNLRLVYVSAGFSPQSFLREKILGPGDAARQVRRGSAERRRH